MYSSKRLYQDCMEEGISIGLGYNSLGGSVLYIETLSNNVVQTQSATAASSPVVES